MSSSKKKINIGDLVHWYKYSREMIIVDGGYAAVISKSNHLLEILSSKGIKIIPESHCDLEERGCH